MTSSVPRPRWPWRSGGSDRPHGTWKPRQPRLPRSTRQTQITLRPLRTWRLLLLARYNRTFNSTEVKKKGKRRHARAVCRFNIKKYGHWSSAKIKHLIVYISTQLSRHDFVYVEKGYFNILDVIPDKIKQLQNIFNKKSKQMLLNNRTLLS